MPDEPVPTPEPPPPEQPTLIGGLAPDEMFARGMQSVRMTSGAAGSWQPPSVEEMARLFPAYEILGLLGRGGMGAVYQGRQIELDRLVAIKLLPLEISVDKDFVDRFRREARAMAKLHHPNIITVYEFGKTAEGHLFFVMEYVEGANLYHIIHQVGLDGEQALSIVEQVCTALAYAHGKGIVHRDIKPANVMIDTESQVKVADFGLARLTDPSAEQMGHTMTGTVMGTPDYMAPEQMKGMNVDHRADIYSLGVMVYEMLCREVPRGAFEPPSVHAGCDPRIDPIVIKAMQPNPDRRYQSTQEMKTDVVAVRTPLPVAPQPPRPAGAPLPKPPRIPAKPAAPPPTPETAVMQAISLPTAAKSKTLLYAGIAVGVLVLAAAAFFLFKPKDGGTPVGQAPRLPVGEAAPTTASGALALQSATKDAPFVNTLGMKFVPVPGTKVLFSVWDTRVQDYAAYAQRNEVDNSWTTAAKGSVPVSREAEYPVVEVNWEDAQAFCQWLTEKERAEGKLPKGAKYRLPTDEEWSRAVGLAPELGATPVQKSLKNQVDFPWGKEFPPRGQVGNYADEAFYAKFPLKKNEKEDRMENQWLEGYNDGYATTSPVGSFPANAYGLYDMGGNVWQWCEDWFDAAHSGRVARGGAWGDWERDFVLSSRRNSFAPTLRSVSRGFRCVLSVSEPGQSGTGVLPATTAKTTGGTPVPLSATKDASSENTFGSEPAGIPLWNGPEKVPESPEVRWDDNALRIDNASVQLTESGESFGKIVNPRTVQLSQDAILRGAVKFEMTPGHSGNVDLRVLPHGNYYQWSIGADSSHVDVWQNGKPTTLERRHYRNDYSNKEWLRFEMRVVGNQITCKLEGEDPLVVTDSAVSGAGGVMLYAPKTAWFRDLVYVPLDKPGPGAAAVTYPQPPHWTDATADVRQRYLGDGLEAKGDWLQSTVPVKVFAIDSNEPLRNPIVRVRFSGQAHIWLRRVHKNAGDASYMGDIFRTVGRIDLNDPGHFTLLTPEVKLDAAYRQEEEHEAVFAAQGDTLTLWLDGKQIATARDTTLASGTLAIGLTKGDAHGDGRIKKVEYGELLEAAPAAAPSAAAPDPATIRLWDSAQKLAHYSKARWEDNAVRLDEEGLHSTMSWEPTVKLLSRDMIVRASVRMNPDGKGQGIDLRDVSGKQTYYRVGISRSPAPGYITFAAVHDNKQDEQMERWPLPHTYGSDEYVPLEVRAIGNEFTVKADGMVLGTVHDDSIPTAGGVMLYATAAGYFRDIVYVPLDKLGTAVSTPSTATKDAPFENTLAMKFVPVPIVGGPTGGKTVLFSAWDTRVEDYGVFAKETKRDWPKPDFEQDSTHPAVMVSWEDAQIFCQWLTGREQAAGRLPAGWSYRLPSDHEWSCAVELGAREDAAKPPSEKNGKIRDAFPWGTQWPPPEKAGNYWSEELRPLLTERGFAWITGELTNYRDGYAETSPVASFAPNGFGLYDMGGNVWQWCEDWYDNDQKERVTRGASWPNSDHNTLLSSHRDHNVPTHRYIDQGFRCVLAPGSALAP